MGRGWCVGVDPVDVGESAHVGGRRAYPNLQIGSRRLGGRRKPNTQDKFSGVGVRRAYPNLRRQTGQYGAQ